LGFIFYKNNFLPPPPPRKLSIKFDIILGIFACPALSPM
jgi:hypothetical protein